MKSLVVEQLKLFQLLQLLQLLFLVQAVHLAEDACKMGEVKDLDGSCVKKVQYPKKNQADCEIPDLKNGNIFLRMGGRMVDFYCDSNHVRVPDTEVAICQVTGRWSREIPVCLKPGCKGPSAPEHGEVVLEYESTLARFSCSTGYQIKGPPVLGCEDGENWNATVPLCMTVPFPQTQPAVTQVTESSSGHQSTWLGLTVMLMIALGRLCT